jgi:hypothetical protein
MVIDIVKKFIFIPPSKDGTYYVMALSVRPSVIISFFQTFLPFLQLLR